MEEKWVFYLEEIFFSVLFSFLAAARNVPK